jgi:hypothetical protein
MCESFDVLILFDVCYAPCASNHVHHIVCSIEHGMCHTKTVWNQDPRSHGQNRTCTAFRIAAFDISLMLEGGGENER